jgi:hypothetical protein
MNKSWPIIRNLPVVTKAFLLVAIVTIILAFFAFHWIQLKFPFPSDEELKIPTAEIRVKYLEQYVDLAKAITVGVAVTLISVIIPHMLPEARDRFERYKESRRAYSQAKTSVLYLADRVVNVDRKEAFLLVEKAHRELHFAETFEEVIIDKNYLKWFDNPALWITYNYWQIYAVAEVLRVSNWETSEDEKKLKNNLHNTLEVIHKYFGQWGENCVGKAKKDCDNEVEKEIKKKLELIKE